MRKVWYNNPMNTAPLTIGVIGNLGEFVDALALLNNGHILAAPKSSILSYVYIDSCPVYMAHRVLLRYQLVDEVGADDEEAFSRYYRLNDAGKQFADKFFAVWYSLPWRRRLLLRLK